jgi:hypothetical protein
MQSEVETEHYHESTAQCCPIHSKASLLLVLSGLLPTLPLAQKDIDNLLIIPSVPVKSSHNSSVLCS